MKKWIMFGTLGVLMIPWVYNWSFTIVQAAIDWMNMALPNRSEGSGPYVIAFAAMIAYIIWLAMVLTTGYEEVERNRKKSER